MEPQPPRCERHVRALYPRVIPPHMRKPMLHHYHDSPAGGHRGAPLMLAQMRRTVYWPGMDANIRAWVAACAACKQSKSAVFNKRGLHQTSTNWIRRTGERVSVDIITCMNSSGPLGYRNILVQLLRAIQRYVLWKLLPRCQCLGEGRGPPELLDFICRQLLQIAFDR